MNTILLQTLAGPAIALGVSLLWAGDGVLDDGQLSVTSSEFKTPVVELYTSEGCSSCPPADNWLRRLGQSLNHDFNAVPLAFHVDYWNYLGWTDPYSKPSFTKRQREAPANLRRGGGIYTPEFLVDGREVRGDAAIFRSIRNANSQQAGATIRVNLVSHGTDRIEARIDVDNHSAFDHARAYVAIYESGIIRKIGGGENHGRTLKHDFVVRHWSRPIVIRRGVTQADFDVEIPADWSRPNLGLAAVVVDRDSGETVQAVRTSLAALFPG